MDWQDKLGDLVLGGLVGILGGALLEHWRRCARERLSDFNFLYGFNSPPLGAKAG